MAGTAAGAQLSPSTPPFLQSGHARVEQELGHARASSPATPLAHSLARTGGATNSSLSKAR
eukprot:11635620-Alexandrium_andersonii.AAC.1